MPLSAARIALPDATAAEDIAICCTSICDENSAVAIAKLGATFDTGMIPGIECMEGCEEYCGCIVFDDDE